MTNQLFEPGAYEVHLVDLPPAPKQELDGIIRNQIPVLHPGPIEHILVHHRTYRTDGGWKAMVFLIPKSCLGAGKPCLAIDAVPKAALRAKEMTVSVVGHDFVEQYYFETGVPRKILFGPRQSDTELQADDNCYVIDIHGTDRRPASTGSNILTASDLEQKRFPSITQRQQISRATLSHVRSVIAIMVFIASFLAFFETRVTDAHSQLEMVRQRFNQIRVNDTLEEIDPNAIKDLGQRLRNIASQKSYTPYDFLKNVYESVGPTDSVLSIDYERGIFRIRLMLANPLPILRGIATNPRFADVTSTTISSINQAQTISVTGRFIHDVP